MKLQTNSVAIKEYFAYSTPISGEIGASTYDVLDKTTWTWTYEIVAPKSPNITLTGLLATSGTLAQLSDFKALIMAQEEVTCTGTLYGTFKFIIKNYSLTPTKKADKEIRYSISGEITSWV